MTTEYETLSGNKSKIICIEEKLSVIPNKNVPQTIWRSPVFRKDQLGLKLFVVPVREVKM